MRTVALILAAAAIAPAADNLISSAGWTTWSARPDLAMETDRERMLLKARRFESYGKWVAVAKPVTDGKAYRFSAQYRPNGIESEDTSVAAILSWCKDK